MVQKINGRFLCLNTKTDFKILVNAWITIVVKKKKIYV